MTDDDLTKLVDQMAERWGVGGIDTGTMYGQFALEVAKEVRERCALLCEKLAVDMQQESADRGCPFGELIPDGDEAAEMCAKAIRSQHD